MNRLFRSLWKGRKWMLAAISAFLLFLLLPVVRFADPTNTVLEDRQGRLLSTRITDDGQWRFPECDSIPHKLECCMRLYEDRHFYHHPGINPVSLARALVRNLREGRVVSGGSTITMQVVRLSRKGKARTLKQKLIEMVLALRLEAGRSKEDIFRMYASHAPFGGNVVGIDAASWRYYGRPAHLLSWGEAATLAVLPNAPALIYPGRNQKALGEKRDRLLNILLEEGILDSLSAELAREEGLPGKPLPLPQHCPHLLDRTIREGEGGKRITSTIDLHLQRDLNEMVNLHYQHLSQNEIHNAAVLILDIRRGEVLAYVGNTGAPDEGSGRHVDIIDAPRSSGSILKPFLYTLMLDEGVILPGQLVPDIPTHISGYSPLNFDRSYSGAAPAGQALVRSLNVPAVRMLQEYGLEKFHSRLKELGLETIDRGPGHYGLTLILGGAEVRLWELCRAYMGMARTLNNIEAREYRYDKTDYATPAYREHGHDAGSGIAKTGREGTQVSGIMGAGAIWQCFETLTALQRPDQEGSWESFASSRRIAWKTGTSFGHRDAWAVGITPEYLVGVWTGNADGEGRPGLTGINTAAPLLFDAFNLLPPTTWFQPPYGELEELDICRQSGFRAGPHCPDVQKETVPASGRRVAACPYHRLVHLDSEEQYRVHSDCYEVDRISTRPWFVLPPVMEWYYLKTDPAYRSLPPWAPGCVASDEEAMELIYPAEHKQLFIPRGLDGAMSRLVFEAAHQESGATIHWHLDERYLGETRRIHQMEILAEPGPHRLILVDQEGRLLVKDLEIMESGR